MNRVAAVVAVTAALLVAGGCSDDSDEYTQMCVDQNNVRVDDAHCNDHQHNPGLYPNVFWMYYPMYGPTFPAYGYRVPSGGYRTPPAHVHVTNYHPSPNGGTVTKSQYKAQQKAARQQQKQSQPKWKTYKAPANKPYSPPRSAPKMR